MLDLFNPTTLNIFTDASITKTIANETISCPGAVLYMGTKQISEDHRVLRSSTNNDGEMDAIYLGISNALYYMFFNPNLVVTQINLFSDSQISVFGLRKWIFNWVNCKMGNILYSSKGEAVKNQQIIVNIIKTILDYKLNINLYHQKGHCKNNIEKAKKTFKASNGIDLNDDQAFFISDKNDQVDLLTKDVLNKFMVSAQEQKRIFPVSFDLNNMNFNQYKQLIGGN